MFTHKWLHGISPLFTDLIGAPLSSPSEGCLMADGCNGVSYYATYTANDHNVLVITWKDMALYGGTDDDGTNKFQVSCISPSDHSCDGQHRHLQHVRIKAVVAVKKCRLRHQPHLVARQCRLNRVLMLSFCIKPCPHFALTKVLPKISGTVLEHTRWSCADELIVSCPATNLPRLITPLHS